MGESIRILLVEDDEDVRMLLEHVLLSSGYCVDSAETVAEALTCLEQRSYHLVVADYRLPDGRGTVVMTRAEEKRMPAILMTGYLLQAAPTETRRHDFLTKPIRPDEFTRAVERALGQIGC